MRLTKLRQAVAGTMAAALLAGCGASVVLSAADLEQGATYTVTVDGTSTTVTAGEAPAGRGPMGEMGGGMDGQMGGTAPGQGGTTFEPDFDGDGVPDTSESATQNS